MIRKRKLAIVAVGALLLTGVAFGISANSRDGLKSDVTNSRRGGNPEIYAWYSNEQWTCDGTTVSRPVSCISVKTGKVFPDVQCTNSSPTDEKPVSSFSPFSGEEGAPSTCEQVLSSLHRQRTYSAFKEDVCTSYPEVCRAVDKGNKKQPLYFSNARKSSEVGVVTTKKGLHVFEYSGSILGTQDAGMVLNSLSYEISNYNPDNLKIGNIKLYDSITTVDSLNQFNCVQEYQKNAKKLLITCSLVQPKKTVFTIKDSRGYVPLYLLFDILKSETSNKVMQFKFTGGVYNGKQTKWDDQTYPIRFSTYNETDYCGLYPERCEITAEDISFSTPTTRLSFSPYRSIEVKTVVPGETSILGDWTVSTNKGTASINYLQFQMVDNTHGTKCDIFNKYELRDSNDKMIAVGNVSDALVRFDFDSAFIANTQPMTIKMVGSGLPTRGEGYFDPKVCVMEMRPTDISRSRIETEGDNSGFGPYGYLYEVVKSSTVGKCGSAVNTISATAPTNNLCESGTVVFGVKFDPTTTGSNGKGMWMWRCGIPGSSAGDTCLAHSE